MCALTLFFLCQSKGKRKKKNNMIGGHGRQSDVGLVTLRCQDMLVIDNHCNLNVMKANVTTLSAIDIHGYNGLPLLITSNVIFEEDASFQKDLIIEGNLIAGSTHVLNLLGNVNIAQNLMVNGLILAQTDILVHRDLFVTRDLYLEGTLTVLTDLYVNKNVVIEGNLSVYGNILTDFNIDGNVCMGNLKVQDLYVHTIHGFSPVNFNDIASFGKGANFKQLVKLLAADLQATLGAKIKIKDGPSGGALECEDAAPIMMDKGLFHNVGGNVMVTKIPAAPASGHLMLDGGDHMVMGGNIHVVEQGSGGGSIVVMGGNINVTGHSLTGRGSISVLDGGDINLRNGGSLTINDGGNIMISGGSVMIIDPMTMTQTTLSAEPIGSITLWATAVAPTNYLLCQGQTLSTTTYSALFAVLGVTFGMGGPGTFNLPDLRQRIPIGQNTLGAAPFNTIGGIGGALTTTLGVANMPAHNHGINDPGHSHGVNDPGHIHGIPTPAVSVSTYNTHAVTISTGVAQATSTGGSGTGISIIGSGTGVSTLNNGSGTAFDTYPPILTLNYIIKYA
jgi:microcystin-dependent protein